MAALQALTGGLTPPNEDVEFLQQVGIIPNTASSTTTTPYTSGGDPLNAQTGTKDTGVLQAIQQLGAQMNNGFAQILAKMSDKPISSPMRGGDGAPSRLISDQPIEMESTETSEPSFFNKVASGAKNMVNGAKKMAGLSQPEPTESLPAQAMGTGNETLRGGRRRSRKSRRGSRRSRKSRRRN